MGFSASNTELWDKLIQFGILAAIVLVGNIVRRKIPIIQKSLLPTAVIAGFLALALRLSGWVHLDKSFMEAITYHTTAIGFIALGLRIPRKNEIAETAAQRRDGFKSGALIVSTYLYQGIIGLVITALLGFTLFPNLFKASGILLPLGFGQGPGQANNIGSLYENTYGFAGGQSFGLATATMGYLWACIGGVVYLNVMVARGKIKLARKENLKPGELMEPVEDDNEVPLTEAIDRFTLQVALVFAVYLLTYLVSLGFGEIFKIPALIGAGKTVMPLIWGFNFLIGSMLALVVKWLFSVFRKAKVMSRQYTNNYLLNRISGIAFDVMIVACVCAIDIVDLSGIWIPFLIMTTVGGFATVWYCHFACHRLYGGYESEGMLSMYGMLTGTVSTGIILLREVDPSFQTPAANNLVVGSSSAILLGFPFLLLIGLAPQSNQMLFITIGIMLVYFVVLNFIMFRRKKDKKKKA